MGSFFKGSGGTKEDEVEDGLPCVRYGDIYTQYRYFIKHTRSFIAPENTARYTCISFGDLLFAGSGETLDEIGKAAVLLIRGPAFCAGDVIVFRPEGHIDAAFLGYTADCSTSIYQKSRMGSGVTVMHIYSSELKHLLVLLPPITEQRAIAAFLDRETARIDKLVEKNRLLVERLAEYRTAMITHAVTRGLDPSAPLKHSGVEWLGDIPECWGVRRLQYVAMYRTSNVDKKTEDGELTVRLCNYTDVYYSERISANNGDYMEATASPQEIDRFSLRVGDIVITKDSEDWRDIAVPALIAETSGDFVCGYHLGIIRSSPQTEATFLFRAMQSEAVNEQLQVSASGVTRFGIPNGAVGSVVLPIPPVSEQRAIADHLDRETARINALTSKAQAAIERLQEYRAALITAAVTGKIDLRETEPAP